MQCPRSDLKLPAVFELRKKAAGRSEVSIEEINS
jgi:hypothetical protein